MHCLMCFSALGSLHRFQSVMDDDTFIKIMFTFPEFLIPESKEPVFICSTCLEQISLFYTIKKTSLQNSCRLKQFNAELKGTNNFKFNDLKIIINSDVVSTKREHRILFEVNPNSKYLLSLEDHDGSTHIKEEDNEYEPSQQLVNVETSLIHSQDSGSSRKKRKNSYVNKKDSTFIYNSERKTQDKYQKKRFKCRECHKAFTTRRDLERHTRVHTGDKPYKCTTCQKTFTLPFNLNRHKLTHTGEKPHECDVCHKTFSLKSNLVTHKRIHNNVRPYQCTICQKTFTQRYHLNAHNLTHTGEKPHGCDVCPKTFNNKSSLIIHKRVHNNVRPYKCAVCSKGFTQSFSLNSHMLTHTGEKPHQCHLCEYKCAGAGNLKRHIRFHTGEKPHSCKHCKKSFTTTSELKTHERKLHSNKYQN